MQQSCGLLYDHFFQRGYYYRSRSGCHWNTREFKSFCSKKLWNTLKTFSANVMLDLRLHGTPWLYLLYSKQPRKFCQDCSSWHIMNFNFFLPNLWIWPTICSDSQHFSHAARNGCLCFLNLCCFSLPHLFLFLFIILKFIQEGNFTILHAAVH